MDEKSFAYWLQGYFELTDSGQPLSVQQVQIIKDHLTLVFKKETPSYTIDYSYGGGITNPQVSYVGKPISC